MRSFSPQPQHGRTLYESTQDIVRSAAESVLQEQNQRYLQWVVDRLPRPEPLVMQQDLIQTMITSTAGGGEELPQTTLIVYLQGGRGSRQEAVVLVLGKESKRLKQPSLTRMWIKDWQSID